MSRKIAAVADRIVRDGPNRLDQTERSPVSRVYWSQIVAGVVFDDDRIRIAQRISIIHVGTTPERKIAARAAVITPSIDATLCGNFRTANP